MSYPGNPFLNLGHIFARFFSKKKSCVRLEIMNHGQIMVATQFSEIFSYFTKDANKSWSGPTKHFHHTGRLDTCIRGGRSGARRPIPHNTR